MLDKILIHSIKRTVETDFSKRREPFYISERTYPCEEVGASVWFRDGSSLTGTFTFANYRGIDDSSSAETAIKHLLSGEESEWTR
ncbi:hypothetical protein GOP56_11160 [Brevibacillus sp. 7WMA2]|uniref:hypothetical protein n=1 Tax=Brevibacillus TaxID=55080 RepID=UPI000EB56835|nr:MULTISPECIES: hypothetical protein [Brevibacillus]AYK07760.1 hypothetical protein D8Z77_16060 [Brevibacillus laterosporus]QIC06121.1 hypothetical protein GOP56_11160 [Brevibacillus sp. 7WMA2]